MALGWDECKRQRATCPAPVDYLPSIVDLTTSQTVREIDEIVDDLVGPKGNHTVEPLERLVLSFADDLKKLGKALTDKTMNEGDDVKQLATDQKEREETEDELKATEEFPELFRPGGK